MYRCIGCGGAGASSRHCCPARAFGGEGVEFRNQRQTVMQDVLARIARGQINRFISGLQGTSAPARASSRHCCPA